MQMAIQNFPCKGWNPNNYLDYYVSQSFCDFKSHQDSRMKNVCFRLCVLLKENTKIINKSPACHQRRSPKKPLRGGKSHWTVKNSNFRKKIWLYTWKQFNLRPLLQLPGCPFQLGLAVFTAEQWKFQVMETPWTMEGLTAPALSFSVCGSLL